MASIFDVVDYIQSSVPDAQGMRLQRLCYYAQAWSLAQSGKPLFNEDFYAWTTGPVCLELITSPLPYNGEADNLTAEQKYCINAMLARYGDKNARWLEQLSLTEEPWIEAHKHNRECDGHRVATLITKQSMKEYYSTNCEAFLSNSTQESEIKLTRTIYDNLLERIADLEDMVDKLTMRCDSLEYHLAQEAKARRWMV